MIEQSIKYNKSKTYVMPLLSEFVNLDLHKNNLFLNTYLFSNQENHKDCIYIKFYNCDFSNPNFTKFEFNLTNNKLFVKHLDISEKEVVYIFRIPEEYLSDYYLFLEGKYSKFKEDVKQLILEFWRKQYGYNSAGRQFLEKVKNILYKEEKLKKELEQQLSIKINSEQELGSLINEEDETLN